MEDGISEAVRNMFADKRFHSIGHYLWQANINGKKVGVVVGTKGPRFTNYALGKSGYDRVVAGKRKVSLDAGCVVFADVDNANAFHFLHAFDAIEIQPKLEAIPTRTGAYGEFWVLTPSLVEAGFVAENEWM